MSEDIMTEAAFEDVTQALTEILITSEGTSAGNEETVDFSTSERIIETFDAKQLLQGQSESEVTLAIFEAFIITEIVMTALELTISTIAAIKMPRWRKNYRNQMLMQLSLARFIRRVLFLLQFVDEKRNLSVWPGFTVVQNFLQIYMDFVVVILVFFFIKHMYNSLIIVLVKISQNNFYKVLWCSWLIPLPISGVGVAVMETGLLDHWWVYLLVCCLIRWPLIFSGTSLYVMIVYKVMSEKIRKFARSLTVVTFLLCLFINFYLFFKDIIELWCLDSFLTILASYISGLLMNFLILCFYIILILLNIKNSTHSSRSLPEYSVEAPK